MNEFFQASNVIYRREYFGGLILLRNGYRFQVRSEDFNILKLCTGQTAEQIAVQLNLPRSRVEMFLKEAEAKQIVTHLRTTGSKVIEPTSLSPLYLSFPRVVSLELTYSCNSRCPHCYAGAPKVTARELTTAEIVQLLITLGRHGVEFVALGGGEPTRRPDLCTLIEAALANGVEVELCTNALSIPAVLFNRLKRTGLRFVQVSLDGADPKTYQALRGVDGYNRVVQNIAYLAQHFQVTISTVVSKLNIAQVPRLLDLSEQLQVYSYRVIRLMHIGRGQDRACWQPEAADFRRLLIYLEAQRRHRAVSINVDENLVCLAHKKIPWLPDGYYGCSAGRSLCSIDPNGDVYPCSYLHFSEIKCGSVRKTDLEEIWHHSPIMGQFRALRQIGGRCSTCYYLNNCGGGCRAAAYSAGQKIDGEDSLCYM